MMNAANLPLTIAHYSGILGRCSTHRRVLKSPELSPSGHHLVVPLGFGSTGAQGHVSSAVEDCEAAVIQTRYCTSCDVVKPCSVSWASKASWE